MEIRTTAYVYKICIIGDADVGKTSIVNRWAHGWFKHDYKQTMGVQHYSRTLETGQGKKKALIKMIIWDMAGQKVFKELRKSFYDGATGLVLVCDITRKRTFNNLGKWMKEAEAAIGHNVPIVLVANKEDKKPHRVDIKDISDHAKSLEAPHIITSALTGSNVTDVFEIIGNMTHEFTQGKMRKDTASSKKPRKTRKKSERSK